MLWHKVERAVQCAAAGIDGQVKSNISDIAVPLKRMQCPWRLRLLE